MLLILREVLVIVKCLTVFECMNCKLPENECVFRLHIDNKFMFISKRCGRYPR